ncbi:MAG: HPF/RaiA family ribosome-associated protein [Phycisphaerales bacterium]|jgi:ribosome-associated translation inhibitor RaiA|nr:HPF/RaiA family ribosome-associated protein [Phycisphaerales bacterium]
MNVRFAAVGMGNSAALESHASDGLNASLGRFAHRLQRVEMRLRDVNGPKGGVDACCVAIAQLKRGGRVAIRATDADAYRAIDKAAHTLRDAIRRRYGDISHHGATIRGA